MTARAAKGDAALPGLLDALPSADTTGRPPSEADRPLAERLRPARLAEIVGQEAALAQEAPLGRMLASGRLGSLLLWGPPGCGKTTLARVIAKEAGRPLLALSAVLSGVADLRRAFDEARRLRAAGRPAVLFIDEVHRFNRAQQDGLLHEVEEGWVTLIGATTENPSFALNAALLSRCTVLVLGRLDAAALGQLVARAEGALERTLPLALDARERLVELADGDGRHLLNMVETLALLPPGPPLDVAALGRAVSRRLPVYDRDQDAHYGLISALHKAVRGSDPDAALYWLARMLGAGEDARYVARRLVRMASEDIGLADPQALPLALAAAEAFERLGSPEGELALAQATLHLALAPKSNAAYRAWKAAQAAAVEHGSLAPPAHILNAPTKFMADLGHGAGYAYDHDALDGFSGQDYFPAGLPRPRFYEPGDSGAEAALARRLGALGTLREERVNEGDPT